MKEKNMLGMKGINRKEGKQVGNNSIYEGIMIPMASVYKRIG